MKKMEFNELQFKELGFREIPPISLAVYMRVFKKLQSNELNDIQLGELVGIGLELEVPCTNKSNHDLEEHVETITKNLIDKIINDENISEEDKNTQIKKITEEKDYKKILKQYYGKESLYFFNRVQNENGVDLNIKDAKEINWTEKDLKESLGEGFRDLNSFLALTEKKFKLYMQLICCIFFRAIFKDSQVLQKKCETVWIGAQMLRLEMNILPFIQPTSTVVKKIRAKAQRSNIRPALANVILKTYITRYNEPGSRSFLAWVCLKACALMNTGIVKYFVECCYKLNMDPYDFTKFCYDSRTASELTSITNFVVIVIVEPEDKTKDDWTSYVYNFYGGMFYDNLWPQMSLKSKPLLSSFCIGVLSVFTPYKITIKSFPETSYSKFYYSLGAKLANSKNSIEVGEGLEERKKLLAIPLPDSLEDEIKNLL